MIDTLLESYGYMALMFILFLDSSGIPWPTEATLVFAGGAAQTGGLNVWLAGVSALVGAAIGSTFSYYLGRWLGASLQPRLPRLLHLKPEHMEKLDVWFAKHGHRAVLFGRMVPFVRNFIGFPAGIRKMPFVLYIVYSLTGYALYTAFALTLGYGGVSVAQWVGDIEGVLYVILLIAVVVIYLKWGRKWVGQCRGKG